MKKYYAPIMEISVLESNDVITSSMDNLGYWKQDWESLFGS